MGVRLHASRGSIQVSHQDANKVLYVGNAKASGSTRKETVWSVKFSTARSVLSGTFTGQFPGALTPRRYLLHAPFYANIACFQVDFRKLSRSGRPKYSSSNTSIVNASYAYCHGSEGPSSSAGTPQVIRCANGKEQLTDGAATNYQVQRYIQNSIRLTT